MRNGFLVNEKSRGDVLSGLFKRSGSYGCRLFLNGYEYSSYFFIAADVETAAGEFAFTLREFVNYSTVISALRTQNGSFSEMRVYIKSDRYAALKGVNFDETEEDQFVCRYDEAEIYDE